MRVLVPTPLRSYTDGASEVQAKGATLAEVLADLDRRFPGMRFRMVDEQDAVRTHIKFFVEGELQERLEVAVPEKGTLQIVCALSGG